VTRERIRQIEKESFAKMEREKEKRELKKGFSFILKNILKKMEALKERMFF